MDHAMNGVAGDIPAFVMDYPRGRFQIPTQQVEERGLSRSILSYYRNFLSFF